MHTHAKYLCALYINRVVVTGTIDGEAIPEPVEVSGCAACGLGKRANRDVTTIFAALRVPPG
jgi:hypothetical protein